MNGDNDGGFENLDAAVDAVVVLVSYMNKSYQ